MCVSLMEPTEVMDPIFLWCPSREGGGEMLDARELGVDEESLER